MKCFEDVSLSNRHSNAQDYLKACQKNKDSKRLERAWPCPCLGDRIGKAIETNTGQPVRQHLNSYFHAVQVPFLFLPREALQNAPRIIECTGWKGPLEVICGSTLPVSSFLTHQKEKKIASEISSSPEAKRAFCRKREDNPLHSIAVPEQNWGLGWEVATAFCTTEMLRLLQGWLRVFSLKEIALALLIPTQKPPLIHAHEDIYAVTQSWNQMFVTLLERYSGLTKHRQQATQSHLDGNWIFSSFLK